jgi:hypothetical protein
MKLYRGKLLVYIGKQLVETETFEQENINNLIFKSKILKKDFEKLIGYRRELGEYQNSKAKDLKVEIKLQGKFEDDTWKNFNKAVNRAK